MEKIKHGQRNTRLYNVWGLMKNRCFCKTSDHYKDYGLRGITVCEEWKQDFMCFYNWAYKNGYKEKAKKGECTLDRIDNNGNYEPNNCRWVNHKTQSNNKRNNHFLEYENTKMTIRQWSEFLNISEYVIFQRLKRGLSLEKVLYNGCLRKRKIKTILQYNKKYELIKEWNCSASEIGKQTIFCARNILYCCNGNSKTHKNYIWRYKVEN